MAVVLIAGLPYHLLVPELVIPVRRRWSPSGR